MNQSLDFVKWQYGVLYGNCLFFKRRTMHVHSTVGRGYVYYFPLSHYFVFIF